MKRSHIFSFIFLALSLLFSHKVLASSLYSYQLKTIEGESFKLERYQGSPLMIVNIATRCGLTGQLDDLEKLYQKYKERGFKILAVPSNDFMGQTPEGNEEVANFCRLEYGVTFDLAEKEHVRGRDRHPLFTALREHGRISWNFTKFLVSKEGEVVAHFSPRVNPLSDEITSAIEELLK